MFLNFGILEFFNFKVIWGSVHHSNLWSPTFFRSYVNRGIVYISRFLATIQHPYPSVYLILGITRCFLLFAPQFTTRECIHKVAVHSASGLNYGSYFLWVWITGWILRSSTRRYAIATCSRTHRSLYTLPFIHHFVITSINTSNGRNFVREFSRQNSLNNLRFSSFQETTVRFLYLKTILFTDNFIYW